MTAGTRFQPRIVECVAWAVPDPGVSLEELEAKLRVAGNLILEIDRAGNQIKVLHVKPEDE